MSANHEHTPTIPTTEIVEEHFVFYELEHMNFSPEASRARFRVWLEEIEAAAEQRGAIKALRDAAGAIEKNQVVTQLGHLQPCNSCRVIHMDFLAYRADQMEGDDEQV